jgi:hypothetical protein
MIRRSLAIALGYLFSTDACTVQVSGDNGDSVVDDGIYEGFGRRPCGISAALADAEHKCCR